MIYTFLMEKAKELPFWIFYNPYQIGHDFYIEEFGYGVCTPKWIFAEKQKNNLLGCFLVFGDPFEVKGERFSSSNVTVLL